MMLRRLTHVWWWRGRIGRALEKLTLWVYPEHWSRCEATGECPCWEAGYKNGYEEGQGYNDY